MIGKKPAVIYLATTALTALASGLVLDYIFTHMTLSDSHMTMEAHTMMSTTFKTISAVALLAVLSVALFCSCEAKSSKEPADAAPAVEASESMTLQIEGMTCEHCVATVTRVLKECEGVVDAEVFLDAKEALVEGNNLNGEALKAAVEEAGGGTYKVTLPEG